MHTHEIQGWQFIIEQDIDGWFWTNNLDESCLFPVQSEALADALKWVEDREEEKAALGEEEQEIALYGTDGEQVRREYLSTRI